MCAGEGSEEQTVDVRNVLANFCQICLLLVKKEAFEGESSLAHLLNGIVRAISLCRIDCESANDPFIKTFLSTKRK